MPILSMQPKQDKAVNKKIVYIAHPINGDVKGNIKKILTICKKVHSQKIIPFAHYVVANQYLDDGIKEERMLGIAAGNEFLKRGFIDELWLCGPKISAGMREEIKLCLKNKIPIKCFNKRLRPEFEKILREDGSKSVE